jgi:glycosyltransferase involved in cell wall biosynthesis
MRIGFDISQTGEDKAGCGYFAGSLGNSLLKKDHANKYLLYPYFGTSFWDDRAGKKLGAAQSINASTIAIGSTPGESRSFWGNFPTDGEERLGNPDIVHANNFYCPTSLRKARVVYTLYDLSFAIHPEFTTEANRLVCFDGVFNASCYADFIVAISEYSKKTFIEIFPHYPQDRIRVITLGSRFSSNSGHCQSIAPKGLSADGFWLSVGTFEPRKNLRRLLKAYAMLAKRAPRVPQLVLAGGRGWLEEGLSEFVQELGMQERVRILGYVTDDVLCWLYENCFAFAYPSIFEGFGLPVLEALSLGAAVMTSNTTSLPEVAGEAACYADPTDEQSIFHAMSTLLDDKGYRNHLKSISKAQASRFSWELCASQVLDVYRNVLELPRRSPGFNRENEIAQR